MNLISVPITLRDAAKFIQQHHRHHRKLTGGKFAVAASVDGRIVGVAVAGRPVSRITQQHEPLTGEVTRVCTDGTPNACSFLYARCRRIMQLMGYTKVQTFILDSESGGSVRADGWKLISISPGGSWSVPSRSRVDKHPTCAKKKYAKELVA